MRRRRSKKHLVEEDTSSRWVISYADFITLLFAFFVVLYAASTLNNQKYRLFAAHLDASFSQAAKALLPIQFGSIPRTFNPLEPVNNKEKIGPFTQASNEIIEEEFTEVSSELKTSLEGLVDNQKVKIRESKHWFEIELKAKVLFRSASSQLLADADDLLKPIATLLNQYNNPIQVEGFTDNVPIQNDLFPSNWELSTSRAASVARKLIDFGVDSVRLAAVGYGQNFPIATNATPRGKEANRRVVILVSKQSKRDRLVELQKRGNLVPSKPVIQDESILDTNASPPATQVEHEPTVSLPKPTRTREGGLRFTTVPGRSSNNSE